jgi:hypothetical protein
MENPKDSAMENAMMIVGHFAMLEIADDPTTHRMMPIIESDIRLDSCRKKEFR